VKTLKIIFMLTFLSVSASLFAQQKKKTAEQAPSLSSSIAAGMLVYKKNCLVCHMADGGGVQNMNPPLANTTYVLGAKDKLIKIVLNGFSERVEINDETYTNVMPAQKQLTDKQVADVLTYVRNSFGNKASAVTAAEVKAIRK
jgi:mono/diheme cytochrome c family protein